MRGGKRTLTVSSIGERTLRRAVGRVLIIHASFSASSPGTSQSLFQINLKLM